MFVNHVQTNMGYWCSCIWYSAAITREQWILPTSDQLSSRTSYNSWTVPTLGGPKHVVFSQIFPIFETRSVIMVLSRVTWSTIVSILLKLLGSSSDSSSLGDTCVWCWFHTLKSSSVSFLFFCSGLHSSPSAAYQSLYLAFASALIDDSSLICAQSASWFS